MMFRDKDSGVLGGGDASSEKKRAGSKTTQSQAEPLFDRIRIGGPAAIDAVVDLFYQKVIFDPRISQFFHGVNMERLRSMQKAFLTMAFGGPSKYDGKELGDVHAAMVAKGLDDSHFDAVMDNLGKALTDLKVPAEVIAEAAKIAESTRETILGRDKPQPKAVPKDAPLFDRIGGQPAVDAAVDVFYKKVLSDDRIRKFFQGVDMKHLRSKQKAFLTMAFGGPSEYDGKELGDVHAAMVAKGLDDSHFDAVMDNLGQTLVELKVPNELIQEAAKIAESTRETILGRDKPQPQEAPKDAPLFDRIGGQGAVDAAVDIFYKKVLADKRISQFFQGVEMDRLRSMQKAFLTMAFGGPSKYSGKSLGEAHAPMVVKGLDDSHFDAVVENLGQTLTDLEVPNDLIQEAAKIAESTRETILGRDKPQPEAMPKDAPLFDRIGGQGAVDAAVDIFYKKVLADKRISQFFQGVEMDRLRSMQKAFLTMAFGGPSKYSGKSLGEAHAPMVVKGLDDIHFDAVMDNLGQTLTELKVPAELIAEAAKIAESTRATVLGKDKPRPKAVPKDAPLFDRIGGEAAVDAAVDLFYEKVTSDPRIRHFFRDTDMDRLRPMQKAFLTMAFGGPSKYDGKDLGKAHAPLLAMGLEGRHFDAVMDNLGKTLTELKVPAELIAEAAKIAESTREAILGGDQSQSEGTSKDAPLFDRIGGKAAVDAAVDIFYKKVMEDTCIRHFFRETDMNRLRSMQKAFLTMAFGGPSKYDGKGLGDAHAALVAKGLEDRHFDAVMNNLGKTLSELKVPAELIAEAAKIAESTRDAVLGRDKSK